MNNFIDLYLIITFFIVSTSLDNDKYPVIVTKWIQKYRNVSGNCEPPAKFKEWISLANKLNCSTDPSDYRQIFSDLKPFKDQHLTNNYIMDASLNIRRVIGNIMAVLSKETLIYKTTKMFYPIGESMKYTSILLDPVIDFRIIMNDYDEGAIAPADGKADNPPYSNMSEVFERSSAVKKALGEYSKKCMLLQAPTTFITVPFLVPIFSSNRLKGYRDILLPTAKTGLLRYNDEIEIAMNSPKWELKTKTAVFRGRSTGINFKQAREEKIPLIDNPRFKLHSLAQQQKQKAKASSTNCSVLLDFGLTDYWQYNDDKKYLDEVKRKFPLVKFMSFKDQVKSKYLVIVDGNGWPDRVAINLLSGSLVFIATLHDEWILNQLIDRVHYIKIKPDLSDLMAKMEWAAQNDQEAQKIALNGRKFAAEKFNLEQVQVYNALLMMEYQNLFKSKSK